MASLRSDPSSRHFALAGVVGWPIAHSLSPRLHRYWLTEHGIEGTYVPLAVQRVDFGTVVRALKSSGFKGVNVTVPHKEAAFALASQSDGPAALVGAANLLVFGDGGQILARNTDSEGLAASLEDALERSQLVGRTAVILGAGGAARASVLALESLGLGEIKIVNRHMARAVSLAADLQPKLKPTLAVEPWEEASRAGKDAILVVNATSAGMRGNVPLDLDLGAFAPETAICDLVYNPLETDLLRRARGLGLKTVDGLGMLMHQAVPSFEAFFGVRPRPSPALRLALEASLRDAG